MLGCLAAVAVFAAIGGAARHERLGVRSHRPAWELTPTVAATFLQESYAPGQTAQLVLWQKERPFTLRIFRVAPATRGWNHITLEGTPVSPLRWITTTAAHAPISVPIGDWPSGLYFARLRTEGLTGYATFVVRPGRLGEHPVLVVLPTFTWQAYNFRDDDDDGRGDTWYADADDTSVRLDRPFLARGVPPHFVTYDLPFLQWLEWTHKSVDFITDADLDRLDAAQLRRAYRLVIFPGHHEYVTTDEFTAVTGYRNLGGHLMFLCADDFYWQVLKDGPVIYRTKPWHDLGDPEAALVGIQLRANNRGSQMAPWKVVNRRRWPWMFSGMRLGPGGTFGNGGVEIDHTGPSSPRDITVVAEIPNAVARGFTAQMTYYETPAGAEVFAAGAFTLGGARDALSRQLLQNLWEHMGRHGT
jgi:hypothetical protein